MKPDKSTRAHRRATGHGATSQHHTQRKVFDVTRPGRAPANATSRPIIVGHKPQIKDQSVTIGGVGEPRQLLDSKKKIAIQPVDAHLTPQAATPRVAQLATPVMTTTTPAISPLSQPEPGQAMASEPPAPPPELAGVASAFDPERMGEAALQQEVVPPIGFESQTFPISPAPPVVRAPSQDPVVPPSKPIAPLDDKAMAEAHAAFADLPAENNDQIVVSRGRGGQWLVWAAVILALLLLVAAVADLLLDAGMLTLPLPHTNFFGEVAAPLQ